MWQDSQRSGHAPIHWNSGSTQPRMAGQPHLMRPSVREYLGDHNPFPDETAVEVLRHDRSTWDPAVIVERVGVDEWTVEYADGEQAWRSHLELRPASVSPAS